MKTQISQTYIHKLAKKPKSRIPRLSQKALHRQEKKQGQLHSRFLRMLDASEAPEVARQLTY